MAIGNRRRLKRTRGILNLQAQSATVGVRNAIEGNIIDWSTANVYTKDVSSDQSFSFVNDEDGKSISVILKNTSDSPVTISFPGGLRKKTTLQNTLQPNTQSVYSLVKAGNNIYIHQDVFDTLTEFPDTDGDGVSDNLDTFPNDATESADTDGDGVGDNADAFPNDATETVDTDGDGVGDNTDNAPLVANPDQGDLDQDGLADVLDPDIDGDGVANELDAFPNDPTRSEEDNLLGIFDYNRSLVASGQMPNDPYIGTNSKFLLFDFNRKIRFADILDNYDNFSNLSNKILKIGTYYIYLKEKIQENIQLTSPYMDIVHRNFEYQLGAISPVPSNTVDFGTTPYEIYEITNNTKSGDIIYSKNYVTGLNNFESTFNEIFQTAVTSFINVNSQSEITSTGLLLSYNNTNNDSFILETDGASDLFSVGYLLHNITLPNNTLYKIEIDYTNYDSSNNSYDINILGSDTLDRYHISFSENTPPSSGTISSDCFSFSETTNHISIDMIPRYYEEYNYGTITITELRIIAV